MAVAIQRALGICFNVSALLCQKKTSAFASHKFECMVFGSSCASKTCTRLDMVLGSLYFVVAPPKMLN